jgi:hypothetical protein
LEKLREGLVELTRFGVFLLDFINSNQLIISSFFPLQKTHRALADNPGVPTLQKEVVVLRGPILPGRSSARWDEAESAEEGHGGDRHFGVGALFGAKHRRR